MNPDPSNTVSSPTSPRKAFWIILLIIAVLGGFGAAGYMLLTRADSDVDNTDSTSPKDYISNLTTAHQTASETLSDLSEDDIGNLPGTPITLAKTDPSNSGEFIATAVTRPTRKKTFKDYWEEFLKIFQAKTFRLDGVLTGKPPRVMINRQIVFVGGEINGARVVQATPKQIILDYEGEKYTLKLGETIEP